jgi:hypothetical protein
MACGTLMDLTMDKCLGNIGGIKRVWLREYDADAEFAISTGDTPTITGITFNDTGATWHEFELKKNSASAESAYQVGDGGSVFCQTTLAMTFNRQDAGKRIAIQSLALNEVFAIYEDANGTRWFLGKDNPVTLSEGGGSTGQQKTDLNSYNVSLVDDSMELPYPIVDTIPE